MEDVEEVEEEAKEAGTLELEAVITLWKYNFFLPFFAFLFI